MNNVPKEILDGGYPEDNEWDALNARDEVKEAYAGMPGMGKANKIDGKKAQEIKQDLGSTVLGAPEVGMEDPGQADAGEKAA